MKVVVSMDASKRNRVYHRPDCVYAERILLQNKMTIPKIEAEKNKYHCCKYCGGLQGEVRVNRQIPVWEQKKHIKIDYDKQSEAVCVRTEIGCWKIFYNERIDRYMLYHRNTYRQAENKFRRQNTRQARQRLDELFEGIENKNPEIKKLAFC